MKFHEDIIFKNHSQRGGQLMLKVMNLKGKIIEVHETEYSILDPKMYKPDFVVEVSDKIYVIEFQSSYVDIKDKKRFRFYTAIIDHVKNSSNKEIEVHVLSTVEKEKTKYYSVNSEAIFPIYIHSLKSFDGDKILNNINDKITHNKMLNDYEIMLLTLIPFMHSSDNVEQVILNVSHAIISIDYLEYDFAQFIRGIELMLADKFIKTEFIKTTVANLLGGNMQIVEDYARRYARRYADGKIRKTKADTVINLFKNGFSISDIVRGTEYELNFVKEVLSDNNLI